MKKAYVTIKDLLDEGFKIRFDYLIREKKISNRKLADELKVSEVRVSSWRTLNNSYPELCNVKKIAYYFNVKTKWLIKGFI